jgi:hypothetical protein
MPLTNPGARLQAASRQIGFLEQPTCSNLTGGVARSQIARRKREEGGIGRDRGRSNPGQNRLCGLGNSLPTRRQGAICGMYLLGVYQE